MGGKVKVWCRLGASVLVDPEQFKENPTETLIRAIRHGRFKFDGNCYVPDVILDDLVDEGLLSVEHTGIEFDL